MTEEAAGLIRRLERQQARASAAQHRLANLYKTLGSALTLLRTGEDVGVVKAKLHAKGWKA